MKVVITLDDGTEKVYEDVTSFTETQVAATEADTPAVPEAPAVESAPTE